MSSDSEVSDPLPDEPARRSRRSGIGRILGPLVVAGAILLKLAGSLKFLGIFVAVGGYALIWGWRFGVGFVLLILVHELGHYVEAKRQGLNPQIPVFIPFLGAYVALRNQPFDPVAQRARLGRRTGRRRGGGARVPDLRQRRGLRPLPRARLRRVPAQPLQPDPDRVPRRRPHPPRLAHPQGGRRTRRTRPTRGDSRRSSPRTPSPSSPPSRSAWWPPTSRRRGCEARRLRSTAAAAARTRRSRAMSR